MNIDKLNIVTTSQPIEISSEEISHRPNIEKNTAKRIIDVFEHKREIFRLH